VHHVVRSIFPFAGSKPPISGVTLLAVGIFFVVLSGPFKLRSGVQRVHCRIARHTDWSSMSFTEIDHNYEFDAPKYFDFTAVESKQEVGASACACACVLCTCVLLDCVEAIGCACIDVYVCVCVAGD
jgi:hypothetical protein